MVSNLEVWIVNRPQFRRKCERPLLPRLCENVRTILKSALLLKICQSLVGQPDLKFA